jgi:transposase-like protein
VFLVVFWRLRYKLSLRDLAEMFLIRGLVFTHEAVRDWEAKLQGSEDRAVGLDAAGGRPGERARLDAPLVP